MKPRKYKKVENWLDISELKKGDICLYYETDARISKMIREIDGSDYNHASIYFGNEDIAEAIRKGVLKRNIYDSMIKGGKIEVKRLNPEIADMTPVLQVAETYIGKPYAFSQIFLLIIVCTTRKIRKSKSKFNRFLNNLFNKINARIEQIAGDGKQSLICSELVYRSFDEVQDPSPNPFRIEIKRKSDVFYEKGSIVDLLFHDESDRMVNLEQIENIMVDLSSNVLAAVADNDEDIDYIFENDTELQRLFEDYEESQPDAVKLAGYDTSMDVELKEKILNFYTYTSVHMLGLENVLQGLTSVNVFNTFEKNINPNFVTPRDLSEALNLVMIGNLKKTKKGKQ